MPSVKKVPRKTAPSTGLENRGARPSGAERKARAQELRFSKIEKTMDDYYTRLATDPKLDKEGNPKEGTPGKKKLRKNKAITREATRKIINSNPVKPGSTRVGPISGRGGMRGGAGGGGILGSKIR